MQEDRIDQLEKRVSELEREVALLRPAQVQQMTVTPPPVRTAITPPVPFPPYPQRTPRIQTPVRDAAETEYMIGAKLLPKLGAGLVILAVVFFVAWGYSSGWITPPMIFIAEILFCLGFIAVGQVNRGQKEQFGQILTGIGSCGLYLTFAGGHLAYNLFTGETLVALTLALSFVNLGYGLWSGSKAFTSIGVIGGLAAAQMPLRESKVVLSLALSLLITAPAAFIAARKRWMDVAGGLWLFASVSGSVALANSSVEWTIRLGGIYLLGFLPIAAFARAFDKNSFDEHGVLAPIMAFVTGLFGFAFVHGPHAVLPLLLFGAAVAGLGFVSKAKIALTIGGVAIPAIVAPLCFTPVQCAAIYFGLAIIGSLISLTAKQKAAIVLGIVELALAVLPFSYAAIERPMPLYTEIAVLFEAAFAIIALAFAGKLIEPRWDIRTGVATSLGGFVVMRLSLLLAAANSGTPAYVFTLSCAAYASTAAMLGIWGRRRPLLLAPWLFFCFAGGTYLETLDRIGTDHGQFPMISALLFTFVLASLATARTVKDHNVWHPLALLGWFVFTRWTVVAFEWSGVDLKFLAPATVGWIMCAVALMVVGFMARIRELRYWSFGVMFASVVKILAMDLASTSLPFRVAVLLALGLVMLGGGYVYIKHRADAGPTVPPAPPVGV